MKQKERADQLVYRQGLAESREHAKRLIMEGLVILEDSAAPVPKPGHLYTVETRFALRREDPYVSRGAYKLLTLLEYTKLDVTGLVCLDAGASTGGFTDLLLQRGAARVYAIDVGHNQLHEKLRKDPRVIGREGVNLRDPDPNLIDMPIDLFSADVSFISLTKILGPCMQWLTDTAKLCLLIKPQFELEPKLVPKGVVRNVEHQKMACEKVLNFCREELALHCCALIPSRIKGPKGNQEFLALLERT